MASRRVATAAVFQGLLFACGVGLTLAVQARLAAAATVTGLAALWIAAVAAWQGRLGPTSRVETPERPYLGTARAQLLASLLDQTPAPLVTCDAKGVLRARNRAARTVFGVDDQILHPPEELVEALQTGAASGRVTASFGEAGAPRTYAVLLSDVLAAEDPLRLAVLLDIEPEIRASEAAALRELMQVLSHEIMNGLTPVASLAATVQDLLAEENPISIAQAREALGVLSRRAEGLARFADSYRTLARLPPPTLAPTSLADLIEEGARLFRSRWSQTGAALLTHTPAYDVQMAVDRDQVMQALLNLLANAAEAALAGSGEPLVRLTGISQGDGLVLVVADNGAGVPDALREHIFRPFFTTKPQGTGVGLSLGRQVARGHGGELVLAPSQAGVGAVFELRLGGCR